MKHYNVSAAIIFVDNKILCVQRGPSKYDYISFKYEFPGGKIEEGESPEVALIREIEEELNLSINNLSFFQTVNHSYQDFSITMHAFTCKVKDISIIELREHLEYKLLEKNDLSNLDWAAADIPFVDKLIKEIDV
jgi:8-oxo-dGTP diphosphatase